MPGLRHSRQAVYLAAAFFSIVLSCWASLRAYVINPDAICYLQSAEAMADSFQSAIHLCAQAKWPWYSALIYAVSKLSTFSYLISAQVIDGVFSFMTVMAFLLIVNTLTTSTRVLWFAALSILLLHEFNAVREYIIRDHGFWAFYLFSIFFLLRYVRHSRGLDAIFWSVSMLLASLFRIEGMIFLLFTPFFIALVSDQPFTRRLKEFFQLNVLLIVGMVFLISWLMLHPDQYLGRLPEIKQHVLQAVSHVTERFQQNKATVAQHLLSEYATHDAGVLLFLWMTVWYFWSVINNLSLVYAVMVAYAWLRVRFDFSVNRVLWNYVFLNVLITAVFLAENMFLSKRYLLALSLTLLVWVPFALNRLWENRRQAFYVVIILMAMFSVSGIFDFGYSKKYIRDAGEWLRKNTPSDAKIYSNNLQVMYYTQRFGNTIFIKEKEFSHLVLQESEREKFDYLALRLNRTKDQDDTQLIKELGTPAEVFANKRGDRVSIYKIH